MSVQKSRKNLLLLVYESSINVVEMNNRDRQLEKVIKWAEEKDDIRVMLLTSSLTNPNAPVDIFSDLDIEFVVRDLEHMLNDDSWIAYFGDVIAKIVENEDVFDGKHAMRMVFYADYSKIDFKIYAIDKFVAEVSKKELPEDWDVGYKILIDKDGLTSHMLVPTYTSVLIKKPTQEQYELTFNDYWWDTSYVAKSLWRDEVFYAKFSYEHEIRFSYLQKIIEWFIGSENNWNVTTNKFGRLFKDYLSSEMWEKVMLTFAGHDIEGNWNALFAANDLVREIGMILANRLNYPYPLELDRKMTTYLTVVKSLEKNAPKIR